MIPCNEVKGSLITHLYCLAKLGFKSYFTSTLQSGVHMDSTGLYPKNGLHWTGVQSSPLFFFSHFSLKLSLKSNDIYHSAAFFELSLKIVILYWLWWCYISFYSIFRAEFEKYNTLLIRIPDMHIVELYRIRHWIYWVWIL